MPGLLGPRLAELCPLAHTLALVAAVRGTGVLSSDVFGEVSRLEEAGRSCEGGWRRASECLPF